MLIQIPVSIGELVDKITILSTKTQRLEGVALDHVRQELGLLEKALVDSGIKLEPRERSDLEEVNKKAMGYRRGNPTAGSRAVVRD